MVDLPSEPLRPTAVQRDRRIQHLEKRFAGDLSRNWSVSDMAVEVNLSASHLTRLFRAQTGMAPRQFLQHMRLEHAAALLRQTFLTVKEIRGVTGWTDKTMFIKAFKSKYGVTPTEYRQTVSDSEA